MSGRSVILTTLFLGRLIPPKRLTSASCTYFCQLLKTAPLESAEGGTKVCGHGGYQTQDLWLTSQVPYRLRYAARFIMSWNRIENNALFTFSDAKLKVIQVWKKTWPTSKTYWMEQEWIRLVLHWKLLYIKLGLSPYFFDEFVSHFALLQLYNNQLVLPFTKHQGRIKWWQPSWLSWCSLTRKTYIKR